VPAGGRYTHEVRGRRLEVRRDVHPRFVSRSQHAPPLFNPDHDTNALVRRRHVLSAVEQLVIGDTPVGEVENRSEDVDEETL
jgi:hypothetical protein